jgi:hypothetical protein
MWPHLLGREHVRVSLSSVPSRKISRYLHIGTWCVDYIVTRRAAGHLSGMTRFSSLLKRTKELLLEELAPAERDNGGLPPISVREASAISVEDLGGMEEDQVVCACGAR